MNLVASRLTKEKKVTDTTEAPAQVSISVDALVDKYKEIAELDEQLAAASGSANAGKRAIAGQIATETQETWEDVVSQVVDHIKTLESNNLVGTFTALNKALKDNFGDPVDAFLTSEVETRQADLPEVSKDDLADIESKAKELREEYKAMRNLLDMFGMDVDNVPEPKRMSGSRGKRGPRTLSRFNYFIDGEARSKTQNTISSIANTVANDSFNNTRELREWLVERGLDTEDPPNEWEYTLPNGKVLKAVRKDDSDESGEEEEEEEGEE